MQHLTFACSKMLLDLGSQGKGGGECELVNCGPRETVSLCIMTLTCVTPLVMFESTKESALLLPCIGKAGKGCAKPSPLGSLHQLLPVPPGSWLCGW